MVTTILPIPELREKFKPNFFGIAVLALFVFLGCNEAGAMWDKIARSLEEAKQKNALCAKNPANEACKEIPATELLIRCRSNDPLNLGRCHGTLANLAQGGNEILLEWQCVPSAVINNTEQLRILFVREADRTPEILHLPAWKLFYFSIVKAFPCSLRIQ